MNVSVKIYSQSWPIKDKFTISRGSKTTAEVVIVELHYDQFLGRGECIPYARYGESVESVTEILEKIKPDVEKGLSRVEMQKLLPAGAARNALDCAYWDLEAKIQGKPAWSLCGLDEFKPLTTAYTLSLDTPENMGLKARENSKLPLLKLKLAGPDDLDRVIAVRKNAPKSRIIVDANEGWGVDVYMELAPKLVDLGVEMVEQPLPADNDNILSKVDRTIPVCADESCHTSKTVDQLVGKYDFINIKLDKTGGLTEALNLKKSAQENGLKIMVGCMLGTSLSMAPATIVAQGAPVVDLDGPLLLAKDHDNQLQYQDGILSEPNPLLWG